MIPVTLQVAKAKLIWLSRDPFLLLKGHEKVDLLVCVCGGGGRMMVPSGWREEGRDSEPTEQVVSLAFNS